jgi:hypothetical protein
MCPQELQNQWEVAKQEEESKGAGAADVRRWTGVRNIVEARELLRTLFKVASDAKGQVGGRLIVGGCMQDDKLRVRATLTMQLHTQRIGPP